MEIPACLMDDIWETDFKNPLILGGGTILSGYDVELGRNLANWVLK